MLFIFSPPISNHAVTYSTYFSIIAERPILYDSRTIRSFSVGDRILFFFFSHILILLFNRIAKEKVDRILFYLVHFYASNSQYPLFFILMRMYIDNWT